MVTPFWGCDSVKLHITDTDSLMFEIKTDNFWKDVEHSLIRRTMGGFRLREIHGMANWECSSQKQGMIPYGVRGATHQDIQFYNREDQKEHMKARGFPRTHWRSIHMRTLFRC